MMVEERDCVCVDGDGLGGVHHGTSVLLHAL